MNYCHTLENRKKEDIYEFSITISNNFALHILIYIYTYIFFYYINFFAFKEIIMIIF
jgi:hypothetical protein